MHAFIRASWASLSRFLFFLERRMLMPRFTRATSVSVSSVTLWRWPRNTNRFGWATWTLLRADAVCDLCLSYGPCRPRHTRLEVNRQTGVLGCIVHFMHSVCIVPNYYFKYGVPYFSFPAFSIPAFSTLCSFVPHFPVLHFHALHFCATFSSLAFSTPCRFVPNFPVLYFHVSHFQRPRFYLLTLSITKTQTAKMRFKSALIKERKMSTG